MEIPTIKHIPKMAPRQRKRDGEIITHVLHLGLTTDEALLISEHFTQFRKEGKPSKSFARLLLLQLAENALTEEALIEEMVKWRLRAKLAEELSTGEYQKALHLLAEFKKPKPAITKQEKNPAPPEPVQPPKPKQTRVFVPPPPRKR